MADNRFITVAEAERRRRAARPEARHPRYTQRREPYFFDYVEEQLIEEYGVGVYRRGGLKIHTTIDPEPADARARRSTAICRIPTDPSSAIVAIDPQRLHQGDGLERHLQGPQLQPRRPGHRQPGSAFKTFVLVTALRQGVDPNSTSYTSKPLDLNVPGYGPWKVSTYSDSYAARMDRLQATLARTTRCTRSSTSTSARRTCARRPR